MTRGELNTVADIAVRHNMIVIADEIHADLVYNGHKHTPFMSLGEEIANRTIAMTSATKTFNIAGLRTAILVFGNEQLQTQFERLPAPIRGGVNNLGSSATMTAWTQCDDWLDGLVTYLQHNRDYAFERINNMAVLSAECPESTFLLWINCPTLNEDPHEHFLDNARVAMNSGKDFGPGGEQFVRLNFATSRQILTQILDQMEQSL